MSYCPQCEDLVDTYKEWYQDENGKEIIEHFCDNCDFNITYYEKGLNKNKNGN